MAIGAFVVVDPLAKTVLDPSLIFGIRALAAGHIVTFVVDM
jgi:hypothetical protein